MAGGGGGRGARLGVHLSNRRQSTRGPTCASEPQNFEKSVRTHVSICLGPGTARGRATSQHPQNAISPRRTPRRAAVSRVSTATFSETRRRARRVPRETGTGASPRSARRRFRLSSASEPRRRFRHGERGSKNATEQAHARGVRRRDDHAAVAARDAQDDRRRAERNRAQKVSVRQGPGGASRRASRNLARNPRFVRESGETCHRHEPRTNRILFLRSA